MRLLQPLRTREMALLWGGLSLSAVGDQLYSVTLSWIAVAVFGPAAGYLTALQAAIVLLAALGLGRWADRWHAQSALIGADLVRMAVLIALVAIWLALGRPTALPLIMAIVVLAAAQAVFQPALQAVLPGLVPDRALLPAANALMDVTERSARLLGPGLVALLAGIVPTVHFMSLDAVSFLLSATALLLIRRRRRVDGVAPPRGETLRQAVQRGVQAMTAHPLLGYILRTTAIVNGAWLTAYYLAVPLLIERDGLQGPGGSGLGAFGVVIAAYGCTNLLSTLVLGGRPMSTRPQRLMFTGGLFTGIGTALIAIVPWLPPAWQLPALSACAALSAIGGPMKDIPFAVLRQLRLPQRDLPAGVRAYIAATNAGNLVGMLLAPLLLIRLSPAGLTLLCGAAITTVGLIGLWRYHDHTET